MLQVNASQNSNSCLPATLFAVPFGSGFSSGFEGLQVPVPGTSVKTRLMAWLKNRSHPHGQLTCRTCLWLAGNRPDAGIFCW